MTDVLDSSMRQFSGEHSALLWNSVAFGVLGDATWTWDSNEDSSGSFLFMVSKTHTPDGAFDQEVFWGFPKSH